MQEQGLRWHLMREIEERGAEAVIDDAIAEALDGPDAIYLSVDIDVIDPGIAPGTGTPEPGGMLPRELLRAVRRIAGAVELAGMDIVEVSPPYDHAEVDGDGREPRRARGASPRSPRSSRRAGVRSAASDLARPGRTPTRVGDRAVTETRRRGPRPALRPRPPRGPGRPRPVPRARRRGPAAPSSSSPSGSGRLAVPLAEAGHEVTGVDLDPAMLARARVRADAAGRAVARAAPPRARATRARSACPTPARFRLAFIPLNSIFLMGTRADQAAAVATLAAHLAPGGLAVVDAWLPDADDLARYDGRLVLSGSARTRRPGAP